jgi:hypothetical protein
VRKLPLQSYFVTIPKRKGTHLAMQDQVEKHQGWSNRIEEEVREMSFVFLHQVMVKASKQARLIWGWIIHFSGVS